MTLGRVLVVDDDPHIRHTIRMMLERAGYGVLTAGNGQEAISLMSQKDHATTVDALLSDLDMPAVKGTELIAHFQSHYPMIPITVMTGASDFEFTESNRPAGRL